MPSSYNSRSAALDNNQPNWATPQPSPQPCATEKPTVEESPLPLPIIDWDYLHLICDGNEEFELELLQVFADDTTHYLEEMKAAISSQNFRALEHQAHHVKGASANVGLKTMQAIAAELEYQARQHQIEGASQRRHSLRTTLQEVKNFLAAKHVLGSATELRNP
jgi:HPt (histidine-containing phosphotransfer) domain-containing protein